MADIQEDVTLMAHIRAEDDASDQVSQVEAGFGGLRSTIEDMAAGLGEAFEVTRSIIGGVAGALTAGYYSATEGGLHYAEAVAKVSFLTGESAARAAALISAFRAFGFTTEEATLTVQRLSMRLGAIDQAFHSTGKISASQTQQLKEMGITIKDLTGANGDLNVLLPKIIDHMKAMTDPLERDRLAMQLFGRNFGALAPLIRAGGAAFAQAQGDARKFGLEMSEKQVEAFEAYSSAVETAKEAVQGFVLEFGVHALPFFQKAEDLIKRIAGWWHNLNPHIRESVVHVTSLVTVFGGLIGGGEALGAVVHQLQGLPVIGQLIASTLGPFSILLSYIGPLVAAFLILQHLFQTNKEAAQMLSPIIGMLQFVFKEFLGLLDTLHVVWKLIIGDALPRGQGVFRELAKVIQNDVLSVLLTLGIWIMNAREWIQEHRYQIEDWANKIQILGGEITKFLNDALTPFMNGTGGVKDFIMNQLIPALAQIVWPVVDPAIQAAWGWLKDHGKEVGEALKLIVEAYIAWKVVSATITVVGWIGEFMTLLSYEGPIVAMFESIGKGAELQAARTAFAWVASAAKAVAAWTVAAAKAIANFALMAADAILNAADAAEAWILSSAKALAAWVATAAKFIAHMVAMGVAAVVNAVKAAAAWVWEGVVADAATTASAAKMAAAWIAASAVAVASAARAAAGWLLAQGAMLIVRAATITWTAVQWLLNAALSANPIGLIIIAIALLVAGIIWAYNNVGWFRNAVNALWLSLQGTGAWITGTLLPALGAFFSWLGSTAHAVIGGVGTAFSQLGTTVQNIWQGIASTIRMYVNQIINTINSFIRGVNRITIPDWVPVVGGAHSNIPTIPQLYTGAVVTQPTLAMVGDRGTEVVATLAQAMRAGMVAAQGNGGGPGGTFVFEFHLDGKVVERRTSKITGQRMRLQGAGLGSAA